MKKGFRNIFMLGSSSLFNDIGSEMITPILPFYISQLGGTGLVIGLVSGLREGIASIVKFFSGWLSDRVGKRMPFVFVGYLISVIFKFLLATANLWHYVIAFISLERIGKSRDAPRDALIAESTKEKGKGLGFHQMMDTTGGIIGTIIIIFLFWKLNLEIKDLILIAAGISLFSIVPLFFIKESKFRKTKKSLFIGIKNLNKNLKYFIFVSSVFTLANFGLYLFLILRVKEITGSTLISLIFYAIFNVVSAVFVTYFGKLSDRVGRKRILFAGYFLLAVVGVSFIFLNNLFGILILSVLFGLVYAMTLSNQRALVLDLSAKDMKGTSIGIYSSVIGIISIIGGLAAGILWDISHELMFAYISIIAAAAVVLISFVKEK